MKDILEHAIRTVPHGSGPYFLPWHKVKFSARKNASEGYAYECGLFHIVAIMDTTLLKSGKEGYALGCHALYGTGFQEPISLHGLKQASVRADAPGRISVLYEDGTVREEDGRRYGAYLCGVLNDIAQSLAECAGIFARGEEAYRQGDPAQALELFLEAANKDYPPAQVRCGQMYRTGDGIPEDKEKARAWFTRASLRDDPLGNLYLGQMCYEGEGDKKDLKGALACFCESGRRGNPEAQYRAGRMYYKGEGTKVNYDEAFGWFGKAAEQGHSDAMFEMASMLAQGHGFPQNIYSSLYWMQKSAAAGNETAAEFFPSMCSTMAAKAYSKGDPAYALKLALLLAELGDAEAQCFCGKLYLTGKGTEKDPDKAVEWLTKSAEQGYEDAEYTLGDLYFDRFSKGEDMIQNLMKSYSWYQKVADRGDAQAQYRCGMLCFAMEADDKARYWLEKAAAQGLKEAQDFLRKER